MGDACHDSDNNSDHYIGSTNYRNKNGINSNAHVCSVRTLRLALTHQKKKN